MTERFAEGQGADLIVLGSRGFGPVCRAVIGSTGSRVMQHTDRPVLILPRGAQSSGVDRESQLAESPGYEGARSARRPTEWCPQERVDGR